MADNSAFGQALDIPIKGGLTDAPIIFADTLAHTSAINGVVRLAFVQNMATPAELGEQGWSGRHIVSIAMPISTLKNTVRYLQQTLTDFQDNGWVEKDGD